MRQGELPMNHSVIRVGSVVAMCPSSRPHRDFCYSVVILELCGFTMKVMPVHPFVTMALPDCLILSPEAVEIYAALVVVRRNVSILPESAIVLPAIQLDEEILKTIVAGEGSDRCCPGLFSVPGKKEQRWNQRFDDDWRAFQVRAWGRELWQILELPGGFPERCRPYLHSLAREAQQCTGRQVQLKRDQKSEVAWSSPTLYSGKEPGNECLKMVAEPPVPFGFSDSEEKNRKENQRDKEGSETDGFTSEGVTHPDKIALENQPQTDGAGLPEQGLSRRCDFPGMISGNTDESAFLDWFHAEPDFGGRPSPEDEAELMRILVLWAREG